MKNLILFSFLLCSSVWGSGLQLRVVNPSLAKQASYTSSELSESLPFWVLDGQLVGRTDALRSVRVDRKTVCTLWVMNFSDNKSLSKELILSSLFDSAQPLELWKRVSGRVIFINSTGEFAVSYNCVNQNSAGELVETEALPDLEFNSHFQNILEIK